MVSCVPQQQKGGATHFLIRAFCRASEIIKKEGAGIVAGSSEGNPVGG